MKIHPEMLRRLEDERPVRKEKDRLKKFKRQDYKTDYRKGQSVKEKR